MSPFDQLKGTTSSAPEAYKYTGILYFLSLFSQKSESILVWALDLAQQYL